jgi:hypothetical protein
MDGKYQNQTLITCAQWDAPREFPAQGAVLSGEAAE